MEQSDYKTLLKNFSPQEIAEVKQALAEGGYPVVSAEDILEVLQKVQAQTSMNKVEQMQHVEEESQNNCGDDVNGNVLMKEKNKVQNEATYKYKERSLADKEILALGRQYYELECEEESSNKNEEVEHQQHVHSSKNKRNNFQSQCVSANIPPEFDEHKLHRQKQKQNELHHSHTYRRSSLPSWNSSTHIPRRPIRGPHFPLLNERIRLTPNDFMHSNTHSQMSDLHLYNHLSPRARLERQLRNYYYTHQQKGNQERQGATNMNAARATKHADNTLHRNTHSYDGDDYNNEAMHDTSNTVRPLHSAHLRVNRENSIYKKTNNKTNKLSTEMQQYCMTPADRRAANLIFNITGDSRYRFRPTTNMYHAIQCTSNPNESNINGSNNNAEKVYSHMYNANASDRHRGRPLSSFSVSYLNADGSTLCERADPVQRGAQMRELWRRDRFLHQRQEPSLSSRVL